MPSTPLSPEQRAEAQALAQAIREAINTEIDDLARTLVTTDDAHLFGDNEFKLRDLAHKSEAGRSRNAEPSGRNNGLLASGR